MAEQRGIGAEQADKVEGLMIGAGQAVSSKLQQWSAPQAGIHDDALRLAGNVGKAVLGNPVGSTALRILGAAGEGGAWVGGKVATKMGVDPRWGKWTGGFIGDALLPGAGAAKAAKALKIGSRIKHARLVGKVRDINRAAMSGNKLYMGLPVPGIDDVAKKVKIDKVSEKIQKLTKSQLTIKSDETKRLKQLFDEKVIPKTPEGLSSEGIEKFYGMKPKEMKAKYGFRYVNKGSSKSPNFKLKSTKSEALEVDLRNLRIESVTDPTKAKEGLRKWKYINNKLGMEAHHITPIHVSSKLKQRYLFTKTGRPRPGGLAKWNKRIATDAKKGIFHGNDPRNIAAARGSTKTPTTKAGQRSEIYHRKGLPHEDNPGYHNLEKLIEFDTAVPDLMDIKPYRDLMSKQSKLRNQAMRVRDLLIGKKRQITKPGK